MRFSLVLLFLMMLAPVSTTLAENDPNPFNRLFVPPKERIKTLKDDGVHDPQVPGLDLLQQPADAFKPLPTSSGGNYVNWVTALRTGKIKPRYSQADPKLEAMPMDMFIVMEVKGSMPNVSFPHKAHTEWLECTNCHGEIFVPKKGANRMTMAEIMLGGKCGICHGSVAFPITECRRCHSEAKQAAKTSTKPKK